MTLRSSKKKDKEHTAKPMTAAEMGRKGGRARDKALTAEQKSEIARKAGIQSGYVRRTKAKKQLDAKLKKE